MSSDVQPDPILLAIDFIELFPVWKKTQKSSKKYKAVCCLVVREECGQRQVFKTLLDGHKRQRSWADCAAIPNASFCGTEDEVTATALPMGFSENKSSFQRRRSSVVKVNQQLLKCNKSLSACLRDPLKSGSKSLWDHEVNNEELLLPAMESQTCLHSIHTQMKTHYHNHRKTRVEDYAVARRNWNQ